MKKIIRIERDGKYYTKRGVELTRASNTMTEAQFWAFILSALRKATKFWKPKMDCLNDGRRKYEGDNKRLKWEYLCDSCGEYYPQKYIQIDHIVPCGGLNCAEKVAEWIERAFVEREGYQRLCKDCHIKKTNRERHDNKS